MAGVARREKLWPWLAIAAVLMVTIVALRYQGRLWICACGRVDLWSWNVNSSDNSQHLFDPYSFTHVLHGLLFYGALVLLVPRLAPEWRLWIAIAVEALWEVVENSAVIIQRYREATVALGYTGDTIVNSMGDILCCVIGFTLARRLGFRWSLVVFLLTEIVLVLLIRDSLILNIIMLLYPIPAIKTWQMGK